MQPVLHDAVTIIHFAAVERLDVLRACHGHRPEPRWTKGVREEIRSCERAGIAHCEKVLSSPWLGTPVAAGVSELTAVDRIRRALSDPTDPPAKNLGEAESIYFAEKHEGQFATDDNDAHSFALRRTGLGSGRVIDSIHILRTAVANGDIAAVTANDIANEMEAAGRSFRPEHRGERGPGYFRD